MAALEDLELAPFEPVLGFGLAFITLLALGTALMPVLWPEPVPPVEVSFCNGSNASLRSLRVSGVEFGDLAPRACSAYHRLQRVYARPAFPISDGIEGQGWGPEDRVGERALPSGRYQFVVEPTTNLTSLQPRLLTGVAEPNAGVASKR